MVKSFFVVVVVVFAMGLQWIKSSPHSLSPLISCFIHITEEKVVKGLALTGLLTCL